MLIGVKMRGMYIMHREYVRIIIRKIRVFLILIISSVMVMTGVKITVIH